MDNVNNNEVLDQAIDSKFFDILRIMLYSLIGIIIFFIPVKSADRFSGKYSNLEVLFKKPVKIFIVVFVVSSGHQLLLQIITCYAVNFDRVGR